MLRKSVVNLTKQTKEIILRFVSSFDTVLVDCDGVLWLEEDPLEGSAEVINKFRDLGKKIFFVTNDSCKARDEFITKLENFNFICEKNEIISTAYLSARYLKSKGFDKKAYVIGAEGLAKELNLVGIESIGIGPDNIKTSFQSIVQDFKKDPNVGAVVVGFDDHFNYVKMFKAATYLDDPNVLFVGSSTDKRYPNCFDVVVPGTGTIITAVKTAAQREPFIVGKPSSYIAEFIKNEHGIDPEKTLMIGDNCNTDIILGTQCGFQTLLVLSGISTIEEVWAWKESSKKDDVDLLPDVYIDKLGELLQFLEELHN